MTLLISLRHSNPSPTHRPLCAALSRLWMVTGLGLSGQALQIHGAVEIYSREDEKFNLDNIKSGWCYRLTPM
ncbi:hypothetical protein [Leptolyngbya sp. NIES-2104]|uniref:hypothetical protein n=1 Tax=Leptolyngbya sp. NIES-2104 TaxID=1552121 RepID=UPI0012E3F8AB|nr:hypothetical protein [Leptolyngbya sp. NIES-2104]